MPRRAALGLTDREREVTELIADGLSDRQVAERLGISRNTVGVHVRAILAKVRLASRAELAAWWQLGRSVDEG